MAERTERAAPRDTLWWLVLSPSIWALHFLASYVTAAVWCAKASGRTGSLEPASLAISAYSALALAFVVRNAVLSYRRHRFAGGELPHDRDTAEDRHRFLGLAGLLLSSLSGVAILYTAYASLALDTCR